MARAVAPGSPHHVVQRGNRRQQTFFSDDDYRLYIGLMAEWCDKCQVEIWAYCLMPNHVHLIAVPETKDGLGRAIGEAHRRYTRMINLREGWTGFLWQGRFSSFIMDERYLIACARYIELNPVRAGLVKKPESWPWSSAFSHIYGRKDCLMKTAPLLKLVDKNWDDFLSVKSAASDMEKFRSHEKSGRPLGSDQFIEKLELMLNRTLKPRKAGRKKQKQKKDTNKASEN